MLLCDTYGMEERGEIEGFGPYGRTIESCIMCEVLRGVFFGWIEAGSCSALLYLVIIISWRKLSTFISGKLLSGVSCILFAFLLCLYS